MSFGVISLGSISLGSIEVSGPPVVSFAGSSVVSFAAFGLLASSFSSSGSSSVSAAHPVRDAIIATGSTPSFRAGTSFSLGTGSTPSLVARGLLTSDYSITSGSLVSGYDFWIHASSFSGKSNSTPKFLGAYNSDTAMRVVSRSLFKPAHRSYASSAVQAFGKSRLSAKSSALKPTVFNMPISSTAFFTGKSVSLSSATIAGSSSFSAHSVNSLGAVAAIHGSSSAAFASSYTTGAVDVPPDDAYSFYCFTKQESVSVVKA